METQTTRDIFDFLTAGGALAGVVLGLTNLWLYLDQQRVKLRVNPLSARVSPNQEGVVANQKSLLDGGGPAIEVVNLSSFPVEIAEVGFQAGWPWAKKFFPFRGATVLPHKASQAWPRRLNVRGAMIVVIAPTESIPPSIRRAYAMTACRTTQYGTSPALKAMRKRQTADRTETNSAT